MSTKGRLPKTQWAMGGEVLECRVSWEAFDPPHNDRSSFPTDHIPNQHIHNPQHNLGLSPPSRAVGL